MHTHCVPWFNESLKICEAKRRSSYKLFIWVSRNSQLVIRIINCINIWKNNKPQQSLKCFETVTIWYDSLYIFGRKIFAIFGYSFFLLHSFRFNFTCSMPNQHLENVFLFWLSEWNFILIKGTFYALYSFE